MDKRVSGKRSGWEVANNNEIEFPYEEALKQYGLTAPRFKRAIDELVAKGFIDIAATGQGTFKVTTYYGISERWRLWGTADFVHAERPRRRTGHPGFRKGNTLWQRGRKKKSTDVFVHGAMHTNVHGSILAMHTNVHGEKVTILYKWNENQWLASEIA